MHAQGHESDKLENENLFGFQIKEYQELENKWQSF
jgi:hypothetical protein